MTLFFIYGPSAVGKTTVGRELASLTGYKFFYNHLTVPAAKAIFPDTDEPHHDKRYLRLLQRLRLDILTAAADAHLDTIFTLSYSGAVDDDFVATIVEAYESRGGRACFVQLYAPDEILLQRVTNSSRSALHMGKMTNPEHLRQALASRDMRASVQYPHILALDTSVLTAPESAQQIVEYFGTSDPAAS